MDVRGTMISGDSRCCGRKGVISTNCSFHCSIQEQDLLLTQTCCIVAYRMKSIGLSSYCLRTLLSSAFILSLVCLPVLVEGRSITSTPSSSSISMRWSRPCVFNQDTQSQTASDTPTSSDATSTSVVVEDLPRSSTNLKQSLNGVATKARHLRDHVLTLKRDYVSNNRIQDQNVANDLEKQEFHIVGMPTRVRQNLPSRNSWTALELRSQVNDTISHFFEDMARVSIFIEFAKRREEAEPGVSFADNYQRIQNQHGFYWIMCKLQHIAQTESGDDDVPMLHSEIHAAIANIQPQPAESRVYGYYHDYLVLSNLERLLNHLNSHSQHLANLH